MLSVSLSSIPLIEIPTVAFLVEMIWFNSFLKSLIVCDFRRVIRKSVLSSRSFLIENFNLVIQKSRLKNLLLIYHQKSYLPR